LRASQGVIVRAFGVEWAFDQCIAALHYTATAERGEFDFFFLSWFEAHWRAGGNIQVHAVSGRPIEFELAIGFEKMKMTTHLDRPVARVAHDYARCFAAGVRFDGPGGFFQKIFARFHVRAPGSNTVQ
jgi:hypothetical protein